MHTITMPPSPVAALSTMADALPGLGIVAAVLGVVINMGSLGGPPEEIWATRWRRTGRNVSGHSAVLRILGPIAANMLKATEESTPTIRCCGDHRELYEGFAADDCGGVRAAGNSGQRAAVIPGHGKIHQGQG